MESLADGDGIDPPAEQNAQECYQDPLPLFYRNDPSSSRQNEPLGRNPKPWAGADPPLEKVNLSS
jgi:hypothetical protein